MEKKRCQKLIQPSALLSLLLFFAFVPAFASTNQCADLFREAPEFRIHQRAEELRNHLFAVHATSIFPSNGVLVAGARYNSEGIANTAAEPPSFRPTIHFSIGELVRSHRGGSWDKLPYAVVLPLRFLESQLVNINPYDSFILGDYKIPPEAIFVVPTSEAHKVPFGFKYVTYEHGQTLRQAVDQVILDNGGWKVSMRERADIGARADMDGVNINTKEFFDPLLRENSHLSFGSHRYSEVGEIYRIGNIDQTLNFLITAFNPHGPPLSYNEIMIMDGFVRQHLQKLDSYLSSADLSDKSMAVYKAKRQNVMEWLNIIDMEKYANGRAGVTLSRVNNLILDNLMHLKSDPKKLRQYVDSLIQSNKLRSADTVTGLATASFLAEYLAPTNPSEVKQLLNQHPNALSTKDAKLFWSLYATRRILAVNKSQASSEKLFEIIDSRISILNKQTNGKEIAESLFDILSESLDRDSSRLPLALETLSRPVIRDLLRDQLNMELPQHVTLIDVLKNHPATRELFEMRTPPYRNKQEAIAYRMLQLLEGSSGDIRQDLNSVSFLNAKSQAIKTQWAEKVLRENISQVMQPMRASRPLESLSFGDQLMFYQQIQRGDYGSLDDVAKKLGISNQFRKAFPNDQSFWQSPLSLLQIYQRLSK